MITVTNSAKYFFQCILEYMHQSDFSLRLSHGEGYGQFRFLTDEERCDDLIVRYYGKPVLLIGSEISSFLEGAIIDCEELDGGIYLTLSFKYAQ